MSIIGIVIIVIVVVIVIWLIAGGISQNSSPPAEPPYDKCAGCRKVDTWWGGLDWFGKITGSAWYALQKAGCAIMGC